MSDKIDDIDYTPLATQEDANSSSVVPPSPDVPSTLPNPFDNIIVDPKLIDNCLKTAWSGEIIGDAEETAQQVADNLREYNHANPEETGTNAVSTTNKHQDKMMNGNKQSYCYD